MRCFTSVSPSSTAKGPINNEVKLDLVTHVKNNIIYNLVKNITNNVTIGGTKGANFSQTDA